MDDLKKTQKQIASLLTSGKKEPDFFEVVRRLEQMYPNRPRVGYARRGDQDILHFHQVPVLQHPETAMESLQESSNGNLDLFVYFFGLCGVNGPLPLEYTAMISQRSRNYYDRTMQHFLDLINHPFLRLYYRAYADNFPAICVDRPNENRNELFLKTILAQPEGVSNSRKQKCAWFTSGEYLFNSRKSAVCLHGILASLLHLPVSVEDRVTEKRNLPQDCLCRLGTNKNTLLGVNTQIGRRFLTNTHRINIHFGPLDFSQYLPFLPGKRGFYGACSTIAKYLEKPIDFDFVFCMKTETLPHACLNKSVALGHSAWLGISSAPKTSIRIEASRLFTDLYQKKKTEMER